MKYEINNTNFPRVFALLGNKVNDLEAAGYKSTHLQMMEMVLKMYPQLTTGLDTMERAGYLKLLKKEVGVQLLQAIVDIEELPMRFYKNLPKQP